MYPHTLHQSTRKSATQIVPTTPGPDEDRKTPVPNGRSLGLTNVGEPLSPTVQIHDDDLRLRKPSEKKKILFLFWLKTQPWTPLFNSYSWFYREGPCAAECPRSTCGPSPTTHTPTPAGTRTAASRSGPSRRALTTSRSST